MSTEKKEMTQLERMMAQYEDNNKPRFAKAETAKTYDLKNYFNTYIAEGLTTANKEVRILPNPDGTPISQIRAHKAQVDGAYKTFACLKHENNEACPFCEAYDELTATKDPKDKELAKPFNSKLMYIAKVIDRDNEDEGVKFWRFNHDYRKEGIFDKIHGVLNSVKKNKDIFDPETGRDLVITINRNAQSKACVVTTIVPLDSDVLSTDDTLKAEWLADTRTWRDVYAIKSYDYLLLVVNGHTPIWNKDLGKFVAKNGETEEGDSSEEEVTMGLETVKSGIEIAKTADKTAGKKTAEAETDDLPF